MFFQVCTELDNHYSMNDKEPLSKNLTILWLALVMDRIPKNSLSHSSESVFKLHVIMHEIRPRGLHNT